MIYTINVLAMLATIVFGAIGWLKPHYTMNKLNLRTDETNLGLSEIRAASGALFIGLGAGALLFSTPLAFAMVGCAYAGAAVGRLTSIIVDSSGTSVSWSFLAGEVMLAAWLLWANLA